MLNQLFVLGISFLVMPCFLKGIVDLKKENGNWWTVFYRTCLRTFLNRIFMNVCLFVYIGASGLLVQHGLCRKTEQPAASRHRDRWYESWDGLFPSLTMPLICCGRGDLYLVVVRLSCIFTRAFLHTQVSPAADLFWRPPVSELTLHMGSARLAISLWAILA